MSFDRIAEVEALLSADERREGRLWRWYRDGRSDAEWIVANNVKTAPTNARHTIEALKSGVVPNGPTYAAVDAATIRRWLSTKPMSSDLTEALAAQLRLLEEIAGGSKHFELSERTTEQLVATRLAEAERNSGVYVYSLPHYLVHPIELDTRRTLLKVGHSSVDVFNRAQSQSRTTALPEDPVLLRIYPCELTAQTEATFHAWLSQAGHLRPGSTKFAGTEWFLTTLEFLDDIAIGLGLNIEVVNEP